jgi:hypothetical protein
MKMDMYWSQQKVFLLGILSLFPEKLTSTPITLGEYWYYFNSKTDDELIHQLYSYKEAGYLEFKEVPLFVIGAQPDIDSEEYSDPHGFLITAINTQKATDDLTEYLENWHDDKLSTIQAYKPDDHKYQNRRLITALKRVYKRQAIPRINIVDMYGDKTHHYNYEPPFWETVLSPHLVTGQYRIRQMDYDLVNSGQPYVDIEITDQKLHRWLELAAKLSEPIREGDLEELTYIDLLARRDHTISYKGVIVPFTPQEVDVMRVLMQRPEEVRDYDAFTDPYANIFGNEDYSDIRTTLSKLISSTRKKLCNEAKQYQIKNTPYRGWRLEVQPTE